LVVPQPGYSKYKEEQTIVRRKTNSKEKGGRIRFKLLKGRGKVKDPPFFASVPSHSRGEEFRRDDGGGKKKLNTFGLLRGRKGPFCLPRLIRASPKTGDTILNLFLGCPCEGHKKEKRDEGPTVRGNFVCLRGGEGGTEGRGCSVQYSPLGKDGKRMTQPTENRQKGAVSPEFSRENERHRGGSGCKVSPKTLKRENVTERGPFVVKCNKHET